MKQPWNKWGHPMDTGGARRVVEAVMIVNRCLGLRIGKVNREGMVYYPPRDLVTKAAKKALQEAGVSDDNRDNGD